MSHRQHLEDLSELFESVQAVVLGPSPGTPADPEDLGLSGEVLRHAHFLNLPVFGVCFGLQALAFVYGAEIVRAAEPIHGRTCQVFHDQVEGLFEGIPSGFRAVRYNSLVVREESIPECLSIIAWSIDKNGSREVMALRHKDLPVYAVQFHPESVCSQFGPEILSNFFKLSGSPMISMASFPEISKDKVENVGPEPSLRSCVRKIAYKDPVIVFQSVFAEDEDSVWLDSAEKLSERSRFSFMSSLEKCGTLGKVLEFFLPSRLLVQRNLRTETETTLMDSSFFSFLEQELQTYKFHEEKALPFSLVGGFLGFFSYEMKQECCVYGKSLLSENEVDQSIPQAWFLFCDRFVAFDSHKQECFLVCLCPSDACQCSDWMDQMESSIASAEMREYQVGQVKARLSFREDDSCYVSNVQKCLEKILSGDSYELCLTTQLQGELLDEIDPLDLYLNLRDMNSAPYASFIRCARRDLSILSSSPEKFLSIDRNRVVQCKPIKGTIKRAENTEEDLRRRNLLATSIKDQSENLMICDLLRNDIGRVSKPRTVSVPKLMDIETFATVHHMVTTVEGVLDDGISSVECFRVSFPPGSMTGAPKQRSMEILSELEGGPRGIYSGSIGFFSINGTADMNVVIRTAVLKQNRNVSIGCGGAIVYLSDPKEEVEEMKLKSRSVTRVFEMTSLFSEQ